MIYAEVVATTNTSVFLRIENTIYGPHTNAIQVHVEPTTEYPVGTRFALVPWPKGRSDEIVMRFIEERLRP